MKLYGIKNCDTVKKAIKQLDSQDLSYSFIDLKTTELSAECISDWLINYPEEIVNKRSATYRKIKEEWLAADNEKTQIAIIQAHQTVIKRPVLVLNDKSLIIGFDKDVYQSLSD